MEVYIRPRLSHSNSLGNDAEKDTAGCRAFNRKYIVIEDITDEWRYVWRYDPPEPVYAVTLGGFVEPLSRAFVYECIYTKSEYEQIKQTGFDYQTLSWMTHILTDCPDDFDYEKDEPRKAGGVTKQLPRFLRFLRRKTN